MRIIVFLVVINAELDRCCGRPGAAVAYGEGVPSAGASFTAGLSAAASCRPSLSRAATQCAVGRAREGTVRGPQSGERFRGRSTIQAQRGGHPAERRFSILQILGGGDLWVSECVITYDDVPAYSVSVMEFADALVTHETQYFADPFQPPAWRAALAEPIPGRKR